MNIGTLLFGIFMIIISIAVLIFVLYRYRILNSNVTNIGQTGPRGPTPTCRGTAASNFSFSNGNNGLIIENTILQLQTNEMIYFTGNTQKITLQLQSNYPSGVVLYISNLDNIDHTLCNICSDGITSSCNNTCDTSYWYSNNRENVKSFIISANTNYYITFLPQQLIIERKNLFPPPL